jgi:hypothetical protein
MDFVIAVSFVTGLALALAIFLVVRKLVFQGGNLPVTAEWIDELSIERYRPMMRLLDGEDVAFLRTQPGFTPRMAAKLRQQRCQIFRGYLRRLNSDFARICSAIKLVMLQSQHDRPDLATALIRHQAMFAAGMIMVEFRLSLYRWGICGVDVAGLVKIFDVMRLELRTLVPSAVAMGA